MTSRAFVVPALVLAVLGTGGCGSSGGERAASEVHVVASFYPLAWAASTIGGDAVSVQNLTPAGTEPHDLELAPKQVAAIAEADLVLVMGRGFQPAVEQATGDAGRTLVVLDEVVDDDANDPHVWLDPVRMIAIVDAVETQLGAVVPHQAAEFATAADELRASLSELDAEFTAGLADCERRDLFTSHDAFGSLAARYDLQQHGVAGISPDEEPSAGRLAELTTLVVDTGATTIFAESLVSPAIAETLASEAGGLEVRVLNPIEGLTDDDIAANDDYLTLMRANLAELQAGLGCGKRGGS